MLTMAAGLAAQVNLVHMGGVDLTSTSDPLNAEYIGNNPSAIAWNGSDLYAAGFNQSGGTANTGITLIAGALNGGAPSAAFGVLATNNLRGYSGLDISAAGLAAAWDNGGAAPEGIQGFDATGALLWQKSARGGSGVGFDPGFGGVDAGTGWTTFGSGRRALQDNATGADIYTTSDGMIISAPTSGTFWRDMDFDDATGDIYLRRGNDVVAHTRTGGNSLTGSRFIADNGTNGNFIAIQNVAYAGVDGGLVFWNDRSSTGSGQAFANVVKCNGADGTPLAINFGGFAAADGNGAYDFSYDAASNTLAILDFANRTVDVFYVQCGGGALTTTFAHNNGQAGNMFDLRPGNAPLVVDCFDVNLDAGTWDLEIYTTTSGGSHVGIEQDPTAWTLLATVTGVNSLGAGVPTPLPLSAPLGVSIGCGEQRGFYVTVTNGTAINYTTGSGFLVGDVFASNDDLEFLAGTGNVYPFANVFGPPSGTRVFNGNIYYAVQPGQLCGRAAPYGSGCGAAAASYYEQTDAASFDLAGQTVTGTWNGSGYDVSTAAGSVAPVGGAAIALPLGDDDSLDTNTVGGTLGLWVGSNCWIALGGGNSTGFSPSSSTLLSNPSTGVYAWTDLRPLQASGSGLGTVYYEENGAVATVTFDGVEGWNTGLPNTVQFTFDTASGDYSITFGTLSTSNPEDWLVGYSVGGASVDPGATDISAGSFSTPAVDTQALALTSSVPVVGQTWTMQFDNISGPYGWFFFGDVAIDPGYDMTPDGAPGCFAHTNGALGVWAQPVTAGSAQMPVGIPNAASLIGVELTVQGAGRDFGNALGVSTSNGLFAKDGS